MPYSRTGQQDGPRPASPLAPPSRPLKALIAAAILAFAGSDLAAQQPAPSRSSAIYALGRLEPATGLVTVGSRPGQKIEEIKVSVGDRVAAGQVLAILEGREQAEAQLALAELQKRQMEFQRDAKRRSFELERKQFQKTHDLKLAAATSVAAEARKLLDRVASMWKLAEGAANLTNTPPDRQRLEDNGRYVELFSKTTEAELNKSLLDAEAELTKEKQALEDAQLALGDSKLPDNPEFLLPDAQIRLAKAALGQTQVVAPRDGVVLDVIGHAGEVGSGQLLVMGDVSEMVAVAEVFQSDVARVGVGDAAAVSILDQTVAGKVTRVGSLVGRNQATNMDPRALKDVRVVKVWIALDDPKLASKLINMEAEVAITPGQGGGG